MSERLFNEEFLRRLERLALVARRASAGKTQGERRSPKRGQSVEFSDFRPYVAGDDFRRIDWNAYARLERFFIKLFVEEEDLTVHILIDASKSMNWGDPDKLDYAIHVAGALGYIALSGLDRVTVTAIGASQSLPDGGYFSPHRGKRQALPLFTFLEEIAHNTGDGSRTAKSTPDDYGDPAQALRAYANTRGSQGASQPGSLILISDLQNDGWMEGIRALVSRGFEISLIHILAPDEVEPELSGDLKLIDSEDSSEIEITADYDLLSRYKLGLREWQENLQRFCSARGILYIPMQTSLPLDDFLFAWLEKNGVLR